MKEEFFFDMEVFFMALADKTRLRLLNLMRNDEICVCFFTNVLKVSQPKISRHLAYLRNAGIVEARRDGKWMYYRILESQNQFAAKLLQDTLSWLKSQEEMQKDYEKLAAACRAPSSTVKINYLPESNIFAKTHMSQPKVSTNEIETFLL